MNPILYLDLLKQSSYKTTILLGLIHKQKTYFAKKYSKSTRITLNKNNIKTIDQKDTIKSTKYIYKKENLLNDNIFVSQNAKLNNIKIVRYFLNNGYNNNDFVNFNEQIHYLLFLCAEVGNTKIVKLLLKFDVHIRKDYALRWSAKNGHIEIVKLLLEKGADVNVDKNSALRWSAANRHIKIVKLLLEKGADIHAGNDSALRWSAEKGYIEIVKLLLEKDANVHANDDEALKISAQNGHIEIVKLLLEKGSNVHADDDYALRLSAKNGHIEIVKLLLEKGANVHAGNNYSLQWNVKNKHIEIVNLLLEKGAKYPNIYKCIKNNEISVLFKNG